MFWTPKLCRICASIGNTVYPIFTHKAQNDIESKLKKCFKINIFKDDFKPKEVCNNCLDKLNEFCLFVDLCDASNNKFESILYQTNRTEGQDHWQNNRINCKINPALFSPNENGVIVKQDDIIVITQYKSDILDIERDVINENALPINEALESFEQAPNPTVLRHSSKFYKAGDELECSLDEFSFDYQRKKSDYTYESYEEVYNEKLGEKEANCEILETIESTEVTQKTSEKPFKCNECEKSFMRKLTLKGHMSSHNNIKPYKCDVCGKSFPLRSGLNCHSKIHTKVFECTYCSKTFPVASKLERHIRIHTNERPFKCEVDGCNKSFADKRNLVGHQVTHSKERNFSCDICQKTYKTKSQLKDHQRQHTNSTFSCKFCLKSFKWKTNLSLHLKKHSIIGYTKS